jgi:hypothetical protein
MPKYKKQISHELGKEEALARLQVFSEKARAMSDLQGSWVENQFAFSVSVQGLVIKGTLDVEDDHLVFDSKLPLIAMPFVSWLPRILKKGLEFDKHTSLQASEVSASAHDKRPLVLFLHIPKAGGTTLGEFIFNQCRSDEDRDDGFLRSGVLFLSYGFFKEAEGVPAHVQSLLQRTHLRAVIGHFSFGLHQYLRQPSTYVTVLRDPVQRVVSLYHYLKLQDQMSLEDFVLKPTIKEVDNDQTRRIAGIDPAIGECTADMLTVAKQNLRNSFSVVGVTDRFDETLAVLKQRMGWAKDVASYPRNVNPVQRGAYSLSREVVDAIRSRNELDIELWSFASKLLDEALAEQGTILTYTANVSS